MRDLESQNSQLRRDLANYNDTTKLLMDSQDLDGLTKPELAARYGTSPTLATLRFSSMTSLILVGIFMSVAILSLVRVSRCSGLEAEAVWSDW